MLKTGDVLFHEGDQSDGMYLVRKGDILVYLEKSGEELKLAKVTAGAMIGEMALFDKKPRSAAARAVTECEVTKISNDDFKKIMKQIPKWFVALMVSLSTRLRETNERLQSLEQSSKGKAPPLQNVIKVAGVLGLLWHKDGGKEAKSWLLDRDPAEAEICSVLALSADLVKGITTALIKSGLVGCKPNSYKKDVLFVPNKGVIERFVKFCQTFNKEFPGQKSLSDNALGLLKVLDDMAREAAYDNVTISLEDAITEGERRSVDTDSWPEEVKGMKNLGDGFSLTKASGGVGFKVDRKRFATLLQHHAILGNLNKAGVS